MNPKPKTFRSPLYLEHVRKLPCCICGATAEPHHFGGGMGLKGTDLYAIPLCHSHHMEIHLIGTFTFQKKYNMDRWQVIAETLAKYVEGL